MIQHALDSFGAVERSARGERGAVQQVNELLHTDFFVDAIFDVRHEFSFDDLFCHGDRRKVLQKDANLGRLFSRALVMAVLLGAVTAIVDVAPVVTTLTNLDWRELTAEEIHWVSLAALLNESIARIAEFCFGYK